MLASLALQLGGRDSAMLSLVLCLGVIRAHPPQIRSTTHALAKDSLSTAFPQHGIVGSPPESAEHLESNAVGRPSIQADGSIRLAKSRSLVSRCIAEAAGTATIVLLGSGVALGFGLGTLSAAVVCGAAVGVAVNSFDATSGAHFNPASKIPNLPFPLLDTL